MENSGGRNELSKAFAVYHKYSIISLNLIKPEEKIDENSLLPYFSNLIQTNGFYSPTSTLSELAATLLNFKISFNLFQKFDFNCKFRNRLTIIALSLNVRQARALEWLRCTTVSLTKIIIAIATCKTS